MADLEAVLADVSYLMAMEKSKSTSAAKSSKRIILPDPSVRSVMQRHLEKKNAITFDKVFNQRIGYQLFKEFCETQCDQPVPQMRFYDEIEQYTALDQDEERIKLARKIYDNYIMKELLSASHMYSKQSVTHVQEHLTSAQKSKTLPSDLFRPYKEEIKATLRGRIFEKFLESEKFVRFCQWKDLELNIVLSMSDFSVHRIIGRGGFGEVYGARKADTGKMFAMKCLDKKRIKLKGGETLALNERLMLTLVSTGEGCPFIVNMTYAFQSPLKLIFILDLMNGGDLHYHLSQHGVFNDKEVRFYAAEIILGLEHMHERCIVYRDLKPANILLDEYGHVRISDLGLACDFSKKKPHASVGTHGYMAPEVLQKGVAYDSSADWFSFGCMLFKLLKGHSPFRQHRSKDKQEIDKMTMTSTVELPDNMGKEIRMLIDGLLTRDPAERLGCRGRGASELKEHPFFEGIDWQQVYLGKLQPPLVPPRGEVNAADAFDIGNFDDDETKNIKLADADQEKYKNFNVTISDRWQAEIIETIFESVNAEADKVEHKRRSKQSSHSDDEASFGGTDCIIDGELLRLGTQQFLMRWESRYVKLYPNRLEFYKSRDGMIVRDKGVELILMTEIRDISEEFQRLSKHDMCIVITLLNEQKVTLTSNDKVLIEQWHEELLEAFHKGAEMLAANRKATKIYAGDATASAAGLGFQRSHSGEHHVDHPAAGFQPLSGPRPLSGARVAAVDQTASPGQHPQKVVSRTMSQRMPIFNKSLSDSPAPRRRSSEERNELSPGTADDQVVPPGRDSEKPTLSTVASNPQLPLSPSTTVPAPATGNTPADPGAGSQPDQQQQQLSTPPVLAQSGSSSQQQQPSPPITCNS